jgi:hypothetical protein
VGDGKGGISSFFKLATAKSESSDDSKASSEAAATTASAEAAGAGTATGDTSSSSSSPSSSQQPLHSSSPPLKVVEVKFGIGSAAGDDGEEDEEFHRELNGEGRSITVKNREALAHFDFPPVSPSSPDTLIRVCLTRLYSSVLADNF